MKWRKVKPLPWILSIAIGFLPTFTLANYSNQSLTEACENNLTTEEGLVSKDQCVNYVSGYLDGLISAKINANLQNKIETLQKEKSSNFSQRVLETRAGSYMKRLERYELKSSCALNQEERQLHIEQIADELMIIENDVRSTFMASINDLLEDEQFC